MNKYYSCAGCRQVQTVERFNDWPEGWCWLDFSWPFGVKGEYPETTYFCSLDCVAAWVNAAVAKRDAYVPGEVP